MVTVWSDGVEFEVLDSGTVTLPKNADKVSINVDDLKFHLKFEMTDDGEMDFVGKALNDKEIELRLVNCDNPLGVAFNSRMGTIRGGVLTVSLAIHSITDDVKKGMPPRVINYSFFRSAA